MKKLLLICSIFFLGNQFINAQTTEDFETETIGSSSFTDNGQVFNISSITGETYDVVSSPSYGWNGSANDLQYIDNVGGLNGTGNGSSFTITTNGGTDILVTKLYLYCSTDGWASHAGTLVISGKKDGNPVFSVSKSSGFQDPAVTATYNGFTFIDFATEWASDYSTTAIDELTFTSTGNLDYMALDAFTWMLAPACTDPDVPVITSTPSIICPGSSSTLTWTGSLNDATAWHVYTTSCGVTQLTTTTLNTLVVSPGATTTYYIRGEDGAGCVDESTGLCGSVTVTVNTLDNATFSYSAGAYCANDSDPTPIIFGLPGGSFSSSPAGLSINAGTGAIDVSLSIPGGYTITYTTSGSCPNSSNQVVTINALDDATFNYGAGSYCGSDTDPTPTISGLPGGLFSSSPAGMSINAGTGAIDVSLSIPGGYTITYTTSGSCPNSSNVAVAIGTPPATPLVVSPMTVCPGAPIILTATGSGTGNLMFYNNVSTLLGVVPMPPATGSLNIGSAAPNTYTFGVTESNGTCQSLPATITVTVGDVVNPAAVCQNINAYLDGAGSATIVAIDIDGGSTDNCTGLTFSASQTTFTCADLGAGGAVNDLVITAAYDGPLVGGLPKGIELYVINNIADLSLYGTGFANNGGGTDGEEFTFPAVAVTAGTFIYVASDSAKFNDWFGFNSDYVSGNATINGDDAVELFFNGNVIDVFGDIAVDGTNQPWEYLDGWAYRNNGTGNDGTTFVLGNWSFSGKNALDGETTNASATTPIPVGTYTAPIAGVSVILTVTDENSNSSNCVAVVTVIDTISPVINCLGNQTEAAVSACQFTLPDYTVAATVSASDNCTALPTITQSPVAGTMVGLGGTTITLTANDGNGNTTSCNFILTVSSSITGTLDSTICNGASFMFNSTLYNGANTTGVETLTGAASNGCDSVVTVSVTELSVIDVTVTDASPILTANATGATYQWIDCDNGNAIIPTATN
ncbi:MAG: HYR domain-containing protein, partial [Flavobacteriales bacterium]|nr:HYR domain-containing protein [Flavobacteriales bacterium]